ncbi:YbhB/YbcL family Raf kinase inhibitor-like protein [Noviherbaspirillum sp.]|jgi:hypothetical protein|uniref:YbhB/YbcL family Raf kinase inhibitor-like protein n=1 Tax=Noviherbaspirillum sp. TaxID=1926288 RepID=UPI0025FC8317|nr:YbhB/YbcL family Raf kinase inhibitor-like protein [Noviherbaspirillum sp.]
MRYLTSAFFLFALLAGDVLAQDFHVRSADIRDNATLKSDQVYRGRGCEGDNRSPQLEWSGAPSNTRSFAVTMHDPDAANGKGWWHWIVIDIPNSVTRLDSGAGKKGNLPDGARHGRNDFGSFDFGGVCPPKGDKPHHYVLTVHALDIDKLPVAADAPPVSIASALHAHQIAAATLTGIYGR